MCIRDRRAGHAEHSAVYADTGVFQDVYKRQAKCWLREKDEIYLYKGGSALYEVEPLSEYLAAQLAEQICPSYTAYDLSHHHGKLVSKCSLFTSESQGLAKAGRIFGEERTMPQLLQYFSSIGSEDAFRRIDVYKRQV